MKTDESIDISTDCYLTNVDLQTSNIGHHNRRCQRAEQTLHNIYVDYFLPEWEDNTAYSWLPKMKKN